MEDGQSMPDDDMSQMFNEQQQQREQMDFFVGDPIPTPFFNENEQTFDLTALHDGEPLVGAEFSQFSNDDFGGAPILPMPDQQSIDSDFMQAREFDLGGVHLWQGSPLLRENSEVFDNFFFVYKTSNLLSIYIFIADSFFYSNSEFCRS